MVKTEQTKTLAQQLADANTGLDFVKDSKISGEVTPKQIEAWKKDFPIGFYGIKIGDKVAYFKYPERDEINDILSQNDSQKPSYLYEVAANMTFIGGDVELLTNDRCYVILCRSVKAKMDEGESEVLDF